MKYKLKNPETVEAIFYEPNSAFALKNILEFIKPQSCKFGYVDNVQCVEISQEITNAIVYEGEWLLRELDEQLGEYRFWRVTDEKFKEIFEEAE